MRFDDVDDDVLGEWYWASAVYDDVLFQMPSCGLVLCPRSYVFRLPSRCVRRRRRHMRASHAVAGGRRLRVQATLSGVDERQRLPRPFPFIETFNPYLTTLPRPPRVAVDVDEVLGQFLVALNGFCAEEYGMTHDVKDYHVYHFATVYLERQTHMTDKKSGV